jgi:crossover junction endodeoxyribonuclease RuvC
MEGGTSVKRILGVDVGLSGALAILSEEGELLAVEDMPALANGTAKRRTVNSVLLALMIRELAPPDSPIEHAFVEYVGARPAEGPVGAFAFGRCRGAVEGVLSTLGIPFTTITPPCWKRAVGLPTGTDKDKSRSLAISRWPQHADLFARKKDNGRSDAALIGIAGLVRAGKLK